jgi:hypothetical protein
VNVERISRESGMRMLGAGISLPDYGAFQKKVSGTDRRLRFVREAVVGGSAVSAYLFNEVARFMPAVQGKHSLTTLRTRAERSNETTNSPIDAYPGSEQKYGIGIRPVEPEARNSSGENQAQDMVRNSTRKERLERA